ncbi:MAG: cytochrome D1 domain-containing protein [candidate division NC10 bacterium]|nr:cytochrome D1 domain-containing protein [candidate division NC10 bacterium]
MVSLGLSLVLLPSLSKGQWGTGALLVIVERDHSSVVVVDSLRHEMLGRISDLGILHHATLSFSHDARYAYLVTRDGWLNKLDLLTLTCPARVKVGESSIGLAVTQDHRFVAVANYKPPEVKILDAETLAMVHSVPAYKEEDGKQVASRTVGLVDAAGNQLIFSLMDADGIWVLDANRPDFPVTKKFWNIGRMPYDALLTPDGRNYIVGLYHSDHLARLDTWTLDRVEEISLKEPVGESPKVEVRKVPHLGGWAVANNLLFAPVVGEERLAVYEVGTWRLVKSIDLAGTPMFAMASPDGRYVWVNFSGTHHRFLQVIDSLKLEAVKTLDIGDRVFHMGFSPKGKHIYVSCYQENQVVVLDTHTFQRVKEIPVHGPSGIFSTVRAHILGM